MTDSELPDRDDDRRPALTLSELQNRPESDTGLVCPKCGCRHFYTVNTRPIARGVRRLKECRHCKRRLHTVEATA